jgi:hypothetical protein
MTPALFGIPRQAPARNILLTVGIMLLMSVGCLWLWQSDAHVADENHLMENTQAVLLALAWWVHGWRASRMERSSVSFTLHIGLSLLMYSFLLRELEISAFDAPGSQFWTWTEHILRGIGWTCWAFFFVRFFRQIKAIFALRWTILATPLMIVTLCGAVFMASGWPFDKQKFKSLPEATSEFMEELVELNGYFLLLTGAFSAALPSAETDPADGDARDRRQK